MELFLNLIELKAGDTESYRNAFGIILEWMKKYPLKNNKWGPFFEDVPGLERYTDQCNNLCSVHDEPSGVFSRMEKGG